MEKSDGSTEQAKAVPSSPRRDPLHAQHQLGNEGFDGKPARPSLTSRLWLFELFAWVLCALGLAAIAIILSTTQNKPVPSWSVQSSAVKTKLTVTINSVIALFSTLIKSTLLIPVVASLHQLKWLHFQQEHPLADFKLFDGAGKGPLGSAVLIWSLRGRRLACLGAFLTLAALGLDFTLQQLVTYPLRPSPVTRASIPRTNLYNSSRPGFIPSFSFPDVTMFAAAYYGDYNFAGERFLTAPQCLTGNCSWTGGYTSLGVCSRCTDVTNLITVNCSTWNYVDEYRDDSGNLINVTTVGAPIAYCNYSLPNGQTLEGQAKIHSNDPITLLMNNTAAGGSSYFANNMSAHISAWTLMQGNWQYVSDEDNTRYYGNLTAANATECGLDICVQRYNGSVETNVFREVLLDTFTNTSDTSQDSDPIQDFTPDSQLYIVPPEEWIASSQDGHENLYIVSAQSLGALRGVFAGQSESGPLWSGVVSDDGVGSVPASNDLLLYLASLNETQVTAMMASVAESMTRQVRQGPGVGVSAEEAAALGTAYKDLPFVNVRWGWMAYPVALVVLTLLFLITTAIKDARDKETMLWKSATLASFFHPLTRDGRDALAQVKTPDEADRVAEEVRVRCERTEVGYRLVVPQH